MPRAMSVRFYDVRKVHARGMSLRDALSQIAARGQPGTREMQLGPGVRVRLEEFTPTAGFLEGEITRVRADDHPSEVHPHGTVQLNVTGPIGEGVAFKFRERDHVLAIQYDNRIVAPSRFFEYVMQMAQPAQFEADAKADARALAHFRRHPMKKVKIRLAQPQDLAGVEAPMQSAARAFRGLARDYAAPMITLELGVGHEDGALGADAKRMVEGFVRRSGIDPNVKSVKITPDNGAGIENAEINLLDALLSFRTTIPNLPNDPAANYAARQRVVSRALANHT